MKSSVFFIIALIFALLSRIFQLDGDRYDQVLTAFCGLLSLGFSVYYFR